LDYVHFTVVFYYTFWCTYNFVHLHRPRKVFESGGSTPRNASL